MANEKITKLLDEAKRSQLDSVVDIVAQAIQQKRSSTSFDSHKFPLLSVGDISSELGQAFRVEIFEGTDEGVKFRRVLIKWDRQG
jgi:hypothetical protein